MVLGIFGVGIFTEELYNNYEDILKKLNVIISYGKSMSRNYVCHLPSNSNVVMQSNR